MNKKTFIFSYLMLGAMISWVPLSYAVSSGDNHFEFPTESAPFIEEMLQGMGAIAPVIAPAVSVNEGPLAAVLTFLIICGMIWDYSTTKSDKTEIQQKIDDNSNLKQGLVSIQVRGGGRVSITNNTNKPIRLKPSETGALLILPVNK